MADKVIRKPKQWTEKCRECSGSGHVTWREHFSLWTPDEGAEMGLDATHFQLSPQFDVPRNAYICVAHGGASIFEACKEGVGLAAIVDRTVVFEFNGAVAECRPGADPAIVAKVWWRRAYGKTYEESMKDR